MLVAFCSVNEVEILALRVSLQEAFYLNLRQVMMKGTLCANRWPAEGSLAPWKIADMERVVDFTHHFNAFFQFHHIKQSANSKSNHLVKEGVLSQNLSITHEDVS